MAEAVLVCALDQSIAIAWVFCALRRLVHNHEGRDLAIIDLSETLLRKGATPEFSDPLD